MSKQIPRYILSVLICLPCWFLSCFIIVCYLNATGVIVEGERDGWLNIPMFSKYAEPGAIFDPEGYLNLVAVCAQALTTLLLNFKFRDIANFTAKLENHKTEAGFNTSIFIKRFIFEFTDFQLYLFYIGIYQFNLKFLRTNLIALFMVDEVRRILLELVLPFLAQRRNKL